MTAADLHIGRVHQTFDLRAAPQAAEERLRRLAPVAYDRLAGLLGEFDGGEGYWCVRALRCDVALDVDGTDEALLSAWALDLAGAVQGAMHATEMGDQVVYYPSREVAIVDFIASAEAGRPDRWWAWHQLGLVGSGEAPHDVGAPVDSVRLLLDAPGAVPALIRSLRRLGLLAQYVDRLTDTDLVAIAEVSVPAVTPGFHGGSRLARDQRLQYGWAHEAGTSQPVGKWVDRLLAESSILRWCRVRTDRLGSAALVVLAALEIDHGWTATVGRATWSDVMDALVWGDRSTLFSEVTSAADRTATEAPVPRPSVDPGDWLSGGTNAHRSHIDTTPDEPITVHGRSDKGANDANGATGARKPSVPHIEASAVAERAPTTSVEVGEPRPADIAPDAGTTATGADPAAASPRTEAAGLLFLLNLIDDSMITGWWDRFGGDRSVQQILAIIASALLDQVGVPAADPAVSVFAGAWPQDQHVDEGTGPDLTDPRIAACLAELLAAFDARLEEADVTIDIAFVVRRQGVISGAVPWIDVTMPIDDVSVEIRRAALDMDPDWVSWLGTVVRFSYV